MVVARFSSSAAMGKMSSEPDCQAHNIGMVMCGAAFVILAGLKIIVWCAVVIHMDGFNTALRMADESIGNPTAGITATIVAGCFTVLTGIAGCYGGRTEKAGVNCSYFVVCAFLSVFFFCALWSTVQFEATIFPVMDRRGEEFCNASFHTTYATNLSCPTAATPDVDSLPVVCGDYCKARIKDIREMGGCALLDKLCHKYAYIDIGLGECTMAAQNGTQSLPERWHAVKAYSDCEAECNSAINCVGFSHWKGPAGDQCTIISPKIPRTGTWIVAPGMAMAQGQAITGTFLDPSKAGQEETCYSKDTPLIIENLRLACSLTAWLFGLAAGFILCASMCACSMQYTLTTRRKGKKGAGALMGKMLNLSGGSAKADNRKFDKTYKEDEEDEDDASEEEKMLDSGRRKR